MSKTGVEWATHSLNFLKWWCTKVSEGCRHCYMMDMAARFPNSATDHPVWRDKAWGELRRMPPGAACFLADMYDWLHEKMPPEFIGWHFQAIESRPDVTFMALTKRIQRAVELERTWPDNLHVGTSIENRRVLGRIDVLRKVPTAHRFLSIEPLLEDLADIDLTGIAGVIVGGESGANFRPFDPQWARNIRRQCAEQGVAFYFKQSNGLYPGMNRELDGRTWDDLPWATQKFRAVQQLGLFGGQG